jgi:hypothetical protein
MFNTQIAFTCVWMVLQISNSNVWLASFCAIFVYGGVIVCSITTMVPTMLKWMEALQLYIFLKPKKKKLIYFKN